MINIDSLIEEIAKEYGIDSANIPELSNKLAEAIDNIASSLVPKIDIDEFHQHPYADNDFEDESSEQILQAAKRFEKILFG